MPLAVNSTILRNHFLAYGFVPLIEGTDEGASVPLACDQNGILAVGPTSAGGNVGGLIQNNSDDQNEADYGPVVAAWGYSYNTVTTAWDRNYSAPANADGLTAVAQGNQLNISQLFGWNGASFDRVRVANIFYTVVATALGATVVWTPAAGKKFRLMGYTLSIAGTLAATGVQAIALLDSATVIKNHFAHLIQTTTANISGGDTQIGADLGQGQLSAVINNVLSITLSVAMATGGVAVNVWGTEE
jgi:hypothetical protein